jgi:hypothetical protein
MDFVNAHSWRWYRCSVHNRSVDVALMVADSSA